MKLLRAGFLIASTALVATAQQYEFGGIGGAGFLSNVGVSGVAGAATTGFRTGAVAGAFLAHNSYRHIGGEFRYSWMQSNLHIQSGGSEATFAGQAHVVHYDVILHTNRRESKREFFVAFGGGMKVFRGTGQEAAYQPLSQYGYFTKTTVLKPMASIGAGMKYSLTPRLVLRTEFRDYITAFPKDLIAPAPGVQFGSILQDIVPMVGLSYLF
ncbi:MAG: hypothetical protein C5B51_06220 [Terriglobia bacterium]|nr:MAG: hypothetical protein C5B51_06220 [Terriglobia bacterium]